MNIHSYRRKHDEHFREASEGMTPGRRDMACKVALDVLKSMSNYRVEALNGYIVLDDEKLTKFAGKSLQSVLKKIVKKQNCEVCALGACFLSLVKLDNKFTLPTDGSFPFQAENLANRLKAVFTSTQLCLIEAAFEGTTLPTLYVCVSKDDTSTCLKLKASRFPSHQDDELLLKRIMLNIIANGGVFYP